MMENPVNEEAPVEEAIESEEIAEEPLEEEPLEEENFEEEPAVEEETPVEEAPEEEEIAEETIPEEPAEEESLEELRKIHPNSKINIKYGFYEKIKPYGFDNAIYNGKTMWSNTVRFVSEPEIKDSYTYIGDIDIVMLAKNFYNYHINIMKKYNTTYSNWVRDNDSSKLTGLHFVKTDSFYPQNIELIDLHKNDEVILKEIQSKICEINNEIPRRPVHGLHFSRNQGFNDQLKLSSTFINELKSYKDRFFDFLNSEEYNIVKQCNTEIIKDYISRFTKYYNDLKLDADNGEGN